MMYSLVNELMNGIHRKIYYWLPVFIYAIFIFYLSSLTRLTWIPDKERALGFSTPMLFKHAVEYAIFGLLLFRAFKNTFSRSRKSLFLSSLVGSSYGLTDEIHQFFVPYRFCTVEDAIANAMGTLFGCLIALAFYQLTDPMVADLRRMVWMKKNLKSNLVIRGRDKRPCKKKADLEATLDRR